MGKVDKQAIQPLQALLAKQVMYQQLVDSFLLYEEKRATKEDLQRIAQYLWKEFELFPCECEIKRHLEKLQRELVATKKACEGSKLIY